MADSDSDEVEYEPETFSINGGDFTITTIAYLPITQLMNNRTKDVEISGQKLWCGSLGLIQYFINNPSNITGSVVIEMGAGTGVLGMMCKRLGCAKVLLTDHDTCSLNHMVDDIKTNHIDASVERLDWFSPNVNTFRELVGQNPLRIVAGDVLYKNVLLEPLFNTVKLLFTLSSDSVMYLCHVPRAGVDQSDVIQKAESMGFSVEEIPKETWNTGDVFQYCPEDDLVRARIYCMRRGSNFDTV